MCSDTYAFRYIGLVPSVQNTKLSHTHWGLHYNHSEIKIAGCGALRDSSNTEEVTYEQGVGRRYPGRNSRWQKKGM